MVEAAITPKQKEVKKELTKKLKKYKATIKKRTKSEIKDSNSSAEYKIVIPVITSNREQLDDLGSWRISPSLEVSTSKIQNIIDDTEGVTPKGTDYSEVKYEFIMSHAPVGIRGRANYMDIENIVYFDFE